MTANGTATTRTIQPGIFALGTTDHAYVELDLKEGADPQAALADLAQVANVGTVSGCNVVVGVRPSLWATVADAADVPVGVHDFDTDITSGEGKPAEGDFSMPATQHDAWIWVAGASKTKVYDEATKIRVALMKSWTVSNMDMGWAYGAAKDLIGFEDGTENPGLLEAPGVVGVAAGQPGAGSSVLLYQRWAQIGHSWYMQSRRDQELSVGRTKADSIELDEDVMPETSHVSRTVIEVDGEELEMYRRNVAYGDLNTFGTLFVGFSFDQWRVEEMLRRMAGYDGLRDALTRFFTVETGAWYVVPSVEALLAFLPEDDE
ncbi:MAG: Dyp-type peroxidase [Actinomycetaceae bacterium]|nr:Dyp-type peroxidase [Actinomycetaceae bacterium]